MPSPEQIQEPAGDVAMAEVSTAFALVDLVGTYTKEDPKSLLQVDWIGTAAGDVPPCVFQLRVEGQPSGNGGGEAFAHDTTNVSTSALFFCLTAAPHQTEHWAEE